MKTNHKLLSSLLMAGALMVSGVAAAFSVDPVVTVTIKDTDDVEPYIIATIDGTYGWLPAGPSTLKVDENSGQTPLQLDFYYHEDAYANVYKNLHYKYNIVEPADEIFNTPTKLSDTLSIIIKSINSDGSDTNGYNTSVSITFYSGDDNVTRLCDPTSTIGCYDAAEIGNLYFEHLNVKYASVPEPASLALLASGLLGFGASQRKKAKA